jgi:hypothetical protein
MAKIFSGSAPRGCRALAHRTGKALPLEPGILVEQA